MNKKGSYTVIAIAFTAQEQTLKPVSLKTVSILLNSYKYL